MKWICLALTLTCVAGCATAIPATDAVCDGSRAARAAHAAALADTPDASVLQTGARLIALIDAACDK